MAVLSHWLDYLDVRINTNYDFYVPLYSLSENSHYIVFDNWFSVSWQFDTPTRKVFWMRDKYNVDTIYISLNLDRSRSGSYIQFVGHFFLLYSDQLEYFLWLFNVSMTSPDRVRRFDYKFDVQYSTSEIIRTRFSSQWNIQAFSKDWHSSGELIKVWDRKDSQTHEIRVYDKKLDTLVKWKFKYDIPDSPYKKLLDTPYSITRIEIQFNARSIKEFTSNWLPNNSIERIIRDGATLAFQYASKWYLLPFKVDSTFIRKNLDSETFVKWISDKKISLYKSQLVAYADNIRLLASEHELFEFLRKTFVSLDEYIIDSIIQKWSTKSLFFSENNIFSPSTVNRGRFKNNLALQKQLIFHEKIYTNDDIYFKIYYLKTFYKESILQIL